MFLLIALAVLAFIYFFWNTIRDGFVLWTVAFGGSEKRRLLECRSRMHAYVAQTSFLDEVSIFELYQLCSSMVDAADGVGIEAFQDVVLQYKFVSMYRDRVDGSLRGMLLLDEKKVVHAGKDIMVFKLGLALFKQRYRGGALPYILFLYRALRCFLRYPKRQVYVLTKLFSYKSYMIGMNLTQEAYPRYDAETPAFEKSLIDEFGYAQQGGTATYNPETCVVTRNHVRLENHAAPVNKEDLSCPHIQHFVKLNPDWHKGHCLVTCCKISFSSIVKLAVSSILRSFFRSSRHSTESAQSKPRTPSPVLEKQQSLVEAFNDRRVFESSFGDPSSFIVTKPCLDGEHPDGDYDEISSPLW